MATFSSMKNTRKSRLEAIKQKAQEAGGDQKSYNDDRFWSCERDKSGNGYAVIRFLPLSKKDAELTGNEEATPWIHYYQHMFKAPSGKWFVNNCPTTLGNDHTCPVCEENSKLWNTEIPANQNIVRNRKRKEVYIANIYVMQDKANPQNEGKVFLYKFGPKIYEKIKQAYVPEFEDEKSIDPFDFWEGANFKLKVRNYEGFVNYDKSEFESSSQFLETDEEMEEVWKKEHSLYEFIQKDKFKSYDKLKQEFARVAGETQAPAAKTIEEDDIPFKSTEDEDEDEDTLDFFRSKLEED
jgi:hypothetical protein